MENEKLFQESKNIFNKYQDELCTSGIVIPAASLSDEQFKNAQYQYAYGIARDSLIAVVDITGIGSCKMGYAFSCYGMEYLERKGEAQILVYRKIQNIEYDNQRFTVTLSNDERLELCAQGFRHEILSQLLLELKAVALKDSPKKKYRHETEVRNLSAEDKLHIVRGNLQKVSNGYPCYYPDYIPEKILRNVLKKYNKNLTFNAILGIVDTSILGNGKSGCLFTVQGFYWTESLSPVQYMAYDDMKTVICMKDGADASNDYLVLMTHYDMKAHYVRYNSLKKAPLLTLLEQLQTTQTKAVEIEEPKIGEVKIEEPKIEDVKIEDAKTEDTKIEEVKIEEAKIEEVKIEEVKIEKTKVKEMFRTENQDRERKQFQLKYDYMQERITEIKLVKQSEKVRISFVEFEDKPCVYKIYYGRDLTPLYREIYKKINEEVEKHQRFAGLTQIYEFVYYDGNTHVLEERLAGETLAEIIENRGKIEEKECLRICMEICDALEVLHKGIPAIIHRDIKPSNIMRLYDGRIKLFDYDASRRTEGQKSKDTVLMGTLQYAPPEQFGGRETGVYSDIYALGMTMCEMLTGELPVFKGKETYLSYEGRFAHIIRNCIAYDFDKRYQNVAELRTALVSSK